MTTKYNVEQTVVAFIYPSFEVVRIEEIKILKGNLVQYVVSDGKVKGTYGEKCLFSNIKEAHDFINEWYNEQIETVKKHKADFERSLQMLMDNAKNANKK